jgi:hypothetical protein
MAVSGLTRTVTILATQRAWAFPSPPAIGLYFRTLAHQAIAD